MSAVRRGLTGVIIARDVRYAIMDEFPFELLIRCYVTMCYVTHASRVILR